MKRIRLLLGAFLAALLLPSCAKNDAAKSISLTLWTHEDPNRKALEERLITEFMQDHPNVTVTYQAYPSDKIKDVLMASFSLNQGPDIFNIEINDAYPFVASGRVAPVPAEAAGYKNKKAVTDAYLDKMLDPVTIGDTIYGLPLELTNWCVYLNKAIMRDAGLDPEKDAPRTWEAIAAVSEKIARYNGNTLIRRGFDFRYPYYLISWLPMVEQLGGALVSDDGKTAIVNDEAWLTALRYMHDFGPVGKNLGSPTYPAARSLFDNNADEIALSLSGLYQEQRMALTNPAFFASDDWAVIPYPQWEHSTATVPCHYYGHYYMVNAQKSKAQQTAAWQLLAFMLSHSEDYLREVGIIQPTRALFESKTFRDMPYSTVFMDDLEKGSIVYYAENSPLIDLYLKTAVESVMLFGVSPENALAKLKKDVQDALSPP